VGPAAGAVVLVVLLRLPVERSPRRGELVEEHPTGEDERVEMD
jgi:hypothetical protein